MNGAERVLCQLIKTKNTVVCPTTERQGVAIKEYKCPKCGERDEIITRKELEPKCPKCGWVMKRVLSVFNTKPSQVQQ